MNSNINNKKQDCTIGNVYVWWRELVREERVNVED
jgi:hypothetical protein